MYFRISGKFDLFQTVASTVSNHDNNVTRTVQPVRSLQRFRTLDSDRVVVVAAVVVVMGTLSILYTAGPTKCSVFVWKPLLRDTVKAVRVQKISVTFSVLITSHRYNIIIVGTRSVDHDSGA